MKRQLIWGAQASRLPFSASRRKTFERHIDSHPSRLACRRPVGGTPTGATGRVCAPLFNCSARRSFSNRSTSEWSAPECWRRMPARTTSHVWIYQKKVWEGIGAGNHELAEAFRVGRGENSGEISALIERRYKLRFAIVRQLVSGSVWWGEAPDEPAREDARPTGENQTDPLPS